MSEITKLITKGEKFYREGDYRSSLVIFKEVLTIDQNHPEALSYLGRIYYRNNEFEKAKNIYLRLIKANPLNTGDWVMLASIDNKYIKESIKIIEKELKEEIQDPWFYFYLGMLYSFADKEKKSSQAMERFFEQIPENFWAYIDFWELFRDYSDKLPNNVTVRQLLERFPNLEPNDFRAWRLLGQYYKEEADLENAELCFNKALKLNPTDSHSLTEINIIYFQLNKYDKVIKKLEEALKLVEPTYVLLLLLGGAYFYHGESEKAIDYIQYSKKLAPESFMKDLDIFQAEIYLSKGQHEKSIKMYEKLNNEYPNEARIMYNLCLIYIERKEYEKAFNLCNQVRNKDPQNPTILLILGLIYFDQKEISKVEDIVEKLLRIKELDLFHLVGLGNLYCNLGDFDNSIKMYKLALDLDRNSKEVVNHLYGVYKERGLGIIMSKIEPRSFIMWYTLAKSLYKENFIHDADHAINLSLEINPNFQEGLKLKQEISKMATSEDLSKLKSEFAKDASITTRELEIEKLKIHPLKDNILEVLNLIESSTSFTEILSIKNYAINLLKVFIDNPTKKRIQEIFSKKAFQAQLKDWTEERKKILYEELKASIESWKKLKPSLWKKYGKEILKIITIFL